MADSTCILTSPSFFVSFHGKLAVITVTSVKLLGKFTESIFKDYFVTIDFNQIELHE
jgi:hypothetical protein